MSAKQSRIFKVVYFLDIRVSAVGKLTGLLARQQEESRLVYRQVQNSCLYSRASKPALERTQPSIQQAPWGSFPRLKRTEREADHVPSSTAEVKNKWNCYLRFHIRLHGGHRNNFVLRLYFRN